MKPVKIFLSYSHDDEWLKDELLQHLSAMRRSGGIYVWHDRMIYSGSSIDENIDKNIRDSDVYLFLISASFIASDYCIDTEYKIAKDRHKTGDAVIIPVIIRECDWDIGGLRRFLAVPTDAQAIATADGNKDDKHKRDRLWTSAVREIKHRISEQASRNLEINQKSEFTEKLAKVEFIRHPNREIFDEDEIFVEPEIFVESTREQISSHTTLCNKILMSEASLIVGAERSGKTVLAKRLLKCFHQKGEVPVIIKGSEIKNIDIASLVRSRSNKQYDPSNFRIPSISLIIDDFDECGLSDSLKEKVVKEICSLFKRVVLFSYSTAAAVLFTDSSMPEIEEYSISAFTDDKIYDLVCKWTNILANGEKKNLDEQVLWRYENLQIIFNESGLPKYPYSAVTFLELIESHSGDDIAISSFASCYDTLITQRLLSNGLHQSKLDETKNFLAFIAYRGYLQGNEGTIDCKDFEDATDEFENSYFSDRSSLHKSTIGLFLTKRDGSYIFLEEYLWYFLCARYVSQVIRISDQSLFEEFVADCAVNLFRKKYANMLIYVAYFTPDNAVLEYLNIAMSELFAKASSWTLSDSSRSLMLGIAKSDKLLITESADDSERQRLTLLKNNINDVLENAEETVAKYTLPFLSNHIDDMEENIEQIQVDEQSLDDQSYMRSVNALLRMHSVIGHILGTRPGTYSRDLILRTIESMVQASGRYASLNHSIATLLLYRDKDSVDSIDSIETVDDQSFDKKYERTMRIFGFWSVYLSQAGLARYLSGEHSIKALEELVKENENKIDENDKHIPYNYTSVYLIAKLYKDKKFDHGELESIIKKYGEDSAIFGLLRTAAFIYSYYMPIDFKEKQWMAKKLKMSVGKIETQQISAIKSAGITRTAKRKTKH